MERSYERVAAGFRALSCARRAKHSPWGAEDNGKRNVQPKKRGTSVEIKAVIQNRIRESSAANGDCRNVRAPTPFLIEPKGGICNWDVGLAPKMTSVCEKIIKAIVLQVMCEYELIVH